MIRITKFLIDILIRLLYIIPSNFFIHSFNFIITNKCILLNSFKDNNADYNINKNEREGEFATVMRALIWRYVSMKHREMENMGVTEDDINEVKSELSTMKYDFLEVLRKNGMEVPSDHRKNTSKKMFYYFINNRISKVKNLYYFLY